MKTQVMIPKMPELGHSEAYYCRAAHDSEKLHDDLAHEGAKVGQYVTLAMGSTLVWEEKQRYLRHALNRHCVPPRIAEDEVWGFYKDLQNMVRDVAELVSWISSVMTLLPGDVILTGTPAGVGPIVAGDEVSVSIAGIGTLTNPVVDRD